MLAYGYAVVADGLLLQRESFLVQWLAYAAMLLLSVLLFVLALSRVPRKLLVFDDRLLIKSLSYRSTALSFADVDELSVRRFSDVWMNKRIWKCVPLTIGLFRPGIYLRRRNGWAYYFDVRDRGELLRVTEEKLARNTERSPSDG